VTASTRPRARAASKRGPVRNGVGAITIDTLRRPFAQYAKSPEAVSIQRCWSTWNVLCTFLYTSELIAANPMPMVSRSKLAKTLLKGADAVAAVLGVLNADPAPRRRNDWIERDRALILTALLAGLRAEELRSSTSAGKGGKDRRVPIEPALVEVLKRYLDGGAARFRHVQTALLPRRGIGHLGVGGAAVRGFGWRPRPRRTCPRVAPHVRYRANADVSVYTLMKLFGHESMVTSQRYVTAAATETHTAAAQNKLYDRIEDDSPT
jgi:integrase/recombinase XerC